MRFSLVRVALSVGILLATATLSHAEFKAGAAVIDITPEKLPVLLNGGMLNRFSDKINTRVHARAIVLSDGKQQIALVVVDSCMMGRPMLDEVKALAAKRTGIMERGAIMISATHAHSAPSSLGCLGTDADPAYVPFLKDKLVEAIVAAQANLEPARVGFAKANAADFTALRQWIRRPDRIAEDPFGNMTVRANMHAGRIWDDVTGEAGPEDPDLSLISIQAKDGRPIVVMGNFSMHYFGDKDISADYYGLFSEGLKQRIAGGGATGKPAFVGMMSHGCSGDIFRRDYTIPEKDWNSKTTIHEYTDGLLDIAMKAYGAIKYRDDAELAGAEQRLTMKYRVPDKQRLEWAQRIVTAMGERKIPKDTTEVYAREQIILHERQQTDVVVQGFRIGDIGIATTPTETYAITGLKIKAASPLPNNMVIELANGGDGYIPPAEMHLFGGYNTWAARSAGLEVMAEPKITESAVTLLEKVSGQPRRNYGLSQGSAARAILGLKPSAWWRLNEFTGPEAEDASGNDHSAIIEPAVTYYLEGPHSKAFCKEGETNRATHFVGGRLRRRVSHLGDHYSVSLWLWNGMPNDGREVSGWLFSRGHDHGLGAYGDHLGIGGKSGHTGKLIFFHGDDPQQVTAGKTELPRWQWQQVVLVRDADTVRVYLNGNLELETHAAANFPAAFDQCFFGGRSDNDSNWEGRLDEIAVFNRALTGDEVAKLQVR
ncbi:MAG: neutral/alkaline non-lysosomal ceramidase N-terminal domain-containing protein [Prosthecobacter sp.]|nr:neutral/alkaline non-lysosomal ceramidase N-terminal domain-containing protein [Prosthecobacter sp.]